MIQCLDKDLETVGRLVEDTVADLATMGARGVGRGALDACAALDPVNEQHDKTHLPALEVGPRTSSCCSST